MNNFSSIQDLLSKTTKKYRIGEQSAATLTITYCKKILEEEGLGSHLPEISIFVKKGVMTIKTQDPSLAHRLHLKKDSLRSELNKKLPLCPVKAVHVKNAA